MKIDYGFLPLSNYPIPEDQYLQLLKVLKEVYGYDFTGYAVLSLQRRILRILDLYKVPDVGALIDKLTNSQLFFSEFLNELTIGVTEMFRDPTVWQFIRKNILPGLDQNRSIRIWHAGCSTGEEVYSMAIMLKEMDLIDRSVQLATDINLFALTIASKGAYSFRKVELYHKNYKAAGGLTELSTHFKLNHSNVELDSELKRNITFGQHNLVTAEPMGAFDIIFCRNVLLYFDVALQDATLEFFSRCLVPNGYIIFGSLESFIYCKNSEKFRFVSEPNNVMESRR